MERTNWHVITGAPCSGKTTIIRALEALGRPVVHEAARAIIDAELAAGKTLCEIKSDLLGFQRGVLIRKRDEERSLDPGKEVFLDRGVPDSIAYYRLSGLDPAEPLHLSCEFRYRNIFLFERFRFQRDGVRSEDDAEATALDRLLGEAYESLGYRVVRVPVLPPRERLDFILSRL